MLMEFNNIRCEIELIFEQYRKHKYYTLFMNDYNTSVTSSIDKVGGGRSNKTSDKVADHVIKMISRKEDAIQYVEKVERAVEQLPDVERKLIQLRYMSRNHNYINDYTVYEVEMQMSAKTYRRIREEAFSKVYIMLVTKNSPFIPY